MLSCISIFKLEIEADGYKYLCVCVCGGRGVRVCVCINICFPSQNSDFGMFSDFLKL